MTESPPRDPRSGPTGQPCCAPRLLTNRSDGYDGYWNITDLVQVLFSIIEWVT